LSVPSLALFALNLAASHDNATEPLSVAFREQSGGWDFDVDDVGRGLGNGLADESHGFEVELKRLLEIAACLFQGVARSRATGHIW
jgi:hypothetical protein